jgi:hypothetical protein
LRGIQAGSDIPEGGTMQTPSPEYKSFILTRRLKMRGVVETMSEQVPEVREAFNLLEQQLMERMGNYGEEGWRLISHSHSIYNGILIVSFMLVR